MSSSQDKLSTAIGGYLRAALIAYFSAYQGDDDTPGAEWTAIYNSAAARSDAVIKEASNASQSIAANICSDLQFERWPYRPRDVLRAAQSLESSGTASSEEPQWNMKVVSIGENPCTLRACCFYGRSVWQKDLAQLNLGAAAGGTDIEPLNR